MLINDIRDRQDAAVQNKPKKLYTVTYTFEAEDDQDALWIYGNEFLAAREHYVLDEKYMSGARILSRVPPTSNSPEQEHKEQQAFADALAEWLRRNDD